MDGDWQDDPLYVPGLLKVAQRVTRDGVPVLVCGVRLRRRSR